MRNTIREGSCPASIALFPNPFHALFCVDDSADQFCSPQVPASPVAVRMNHYLEHLYLGIDVLNKNPLTRQSQMIGLLPPDNGRLFPFFTSIRLPSCCYSSNTE